MPRIKRWFPVSHDINRDPELWELRTKYGEKILACWLELLSIADRNDGEIPGTIEQVASTVAWHIRVKTGSCLTYIRAITDARWIDVSDKIRVANYAKYHRTREHEKVPSEPDRTRPLKSLKKDSRQQPKAAVDDPVLFEQEKTKPELTVKDLVESWNEWFAGKLPTVELPLATSRHKRAAARLREHQNLDFWKKVFEQIGASAFLMGRNNGTWRCTFDFLVANDTNAIKIFEGSYNR